MSNLTKLTSAIVVNLAVLALAACSSNGGDSRTGSKGSGLSGDPTDPGSCGIAIIDDAGPPDAADAAEAAPPPFDEDASCGALAIDAGPPDASPPPPVFDAGPGGSCGDPATGTPASSVGISGNAVVLSTDPNAAPQIAVASGLLYWIDRGSVGTNGIQSFNGSSAATAYTSASSTLTIEDIVADSTNLYFSEVAANSDGTFTSTIKSSPLEPSLAPTVVTTIANAAAGVLSLSVAGGQLYFTDLSNVWSIPVSGGAAAGALVQLRTGVVVNALAAGTSAPFWLETNGTTNSLVTTSSGAATPVASATGTVLTGFGSTAYWATGGMGVNSSPVDGFTQGGTMQTIATLPDSVLSGASDGSNLYVVTGMSGTASNILESLPVAPGSSPTSIASGFQAKTQGLLTHAVALDESNAYFVSTAGIIRVAK